MPQQTNPITTFTLCDAEPGSTIDDIRRRAETDWMPASVPGGVHEALLAAGRIADPYFDRNEGAVRWVEERDWWYRATVPATPSPPGGRTLLVCKGLDTVADLWLDGEPLGRSENMFRPRIPSTSQVAWNHRPSCSSASGHRLLGSPRLPLPPTCSSASAMPWPPSRPRSRPGTKAPEYGRLRCRWPPCGVRPLSPGAGTSVRGCPRSDRGDPSR